MAEALEDKVNRLESHFSARLDRSLEGHRNHDLRLKEREEHAIRLDERSGKIDGGTLRNAVLLALALYGVLGGIVTFYASTLVDPIKEDVKEARDSVSEAATQGAVAELREKLAVIQSQTATIALQQADINTLKGTVLKLEDVAAESGIRAVRQVRADLERLANTQAADTLKNEDRHDKYNAAIASLERTIAGTLTTADIEQRLGTVQIAIQSVRELSDSGDAAIIGQNERIITQRIQPRLDRLEDELRDIRGEPLGDLRESSARIQMRVDQLQRDINALKDKGP